MKDLKMILHLCVNLLRELMEAQEFEKKEMGKLFDTTVKL
jgi:hypothetical protein